MLAKLVKALPEGREWIYEIKWDGFRLIALRHGRTVRLWSRNGNELTATYPSIRDAVETTSAHTCLMDGELVALDEKGQPSFQALQHRKSLAANHRLVYFAFDLLNLNGKDLRDLPLHIRKQELAKVLAGSQVQLSAGLKGERRTIIEAIQQSGLEGLVAKRRDSRYESGDRSGAWVKVQFKRQQEFVIGGYSPYGASFSSILAGYYEEGKLMFAGKVRGGFNPHTRAELFRALRPLETDVCAFANLPTSKTGHWGEGMTAAQMAEMQWVKPKLVAQIRFTEWTRDGNLRHADYLGLREDKRTSEVVRERAAGNHE